jgi:hypothetical protein
MAEHFRDYFYPGLLMPSASNLDIARQATVVGPLQVFAFLQ